MTNIRLALRTLFKAPVVTGVAVVSLALGIGSNGAIFSLYSQIVARPLPVAEPERLVNLASPGPQPGPCRRDNAGECDEVFSYPMFRDLQRKQTVFTDVAAHKGLRANVTFHDRTVNAQGTLVSVSGSYFPVLGLPPPPGACSAPRSTRPGARGCRASVSKHPRRRRGAAADRHERADPDPIPRPAASAPTRTAGTEPDEPRGGAFGAVVSLRHHGHRPADRLREYRESAARAFGRPNGRDGSATLAGRRAPTSADAAPDGVLPARAHGGRGGAGRRPLDTALRVAAPAVRHRRPPSHGTGARPAHRPLHRRRLAGDRHGFRDLPRALRRTCEPDHGARGRRRPARRHPVGGPLPPRSGRGAARPGHDAARGGRPLHPESAQRQSHRPGIPDRERRDVRAVARPERLRRRSQPEPVRAGRERAVGAAGCSRRQRVRKRTISVRRNRDPHRHHAPGVRSGARYQPHHAAEPNRDRLLPHPRNPVAGRPHVLGVGYRRDPEGRHRESGVREQVQSRQRCDRHANRARRARRRAGHRDGSSSAPRRRRMPCCARSRGSSPASIRTCRYRF